MSNLERDLLTKSPFKPLSWLSFIYDIETRWIDNRKNLDDFIAFATSFQHSIKLN